MVSLVRKSVTCTFPSDYPSINPLQCFLQHASRATIWYRFDLSPPPRIPAGRRRSGFQAIPKNLKVSQGNHLVAISQQCTLMRKSLRQVTCIGVTLTLRLAIVDGVSKRSLIGIYLPLFRWGRTTTSPLSIICASWFWHPENNCIITILSPIEHWGTSFVVFANFKVIPVWRRRY